MTTTFKIQYQEEVRRASFTTTTTTATSAPPAATTTYNTWQSLRITIAQLFTLTPEDVAAVRYSDSDGDLITVNTDLEVAQLIEAFANSASPLRLVVVTRTNYSNNTNLSTSSSAMDEDEGQTPSPKPTSSSSSSSSASSSSVNVEGILQNLGPLGDHAREFLAHNPELKEEAERFAESLQSGNNPFGGPSPFMFQGGAHPFFGGGQQGAASPFDFFANLQNQHQNQQWHQPQQQSQQQSQQQPQPQPQQQSQAQQATFPEQLKELAEMGFIDETLNLQLLRKYGGRVERVISEIVRLQQQAEDTH